MKSRLLLLLSVLVILSFALGACGGPAAPEAEEPAEEPAAGEPAEEEPAEEPAVNEPLPGFVIPDGLTCDNIVVYSSFPDEEIAQLVGPFTDLTGITISNVVVSSGEGLARIKAEAANPQADFWLSVRGSLLLDALNNDPPLILEYKPNTVDQILEAYQYPDSTYFTGIGMYPLVFHYNPDVSAEMGIEPPQTYEDLVDPKYKGLLLMPHPGTSGTAYSAISLFLQMYGEEDGWQFIMDMAENMDQFTRSGRAPQNLVAQGEYPAGIGFFDAVWYLARDGFPIEPIFPEPIFADPFSGQVVAGAPNEECAKLFFDYLLTPPAQEAFLDYGTYSVRPDVDPPAGAPPITDLDIIDYDWQTWGERRQEVIDEFVERTAISPPTE